MSFLTDVREPYLTISIITSINKKSKKTDIQVMILHVGL